MPNRNLGLGKGPERLTHLHRIALIVGSRADAVRPRRLATARACVPCRPHNRAPQNNDEPSVLDASRVPVETSRGLAALPFANQVVLLEVARALPPA